MALFGNSFLENNNETSAETPSSLSINSCIQNRQSSTPSATGGIRLLTFSNCCKNSRLNLSAMCGRLLGRGGRSLMDLFYKNYSMKTALATNTFLRLAAKISRRRKIWRGASVE